MSVKVHLRDESGIDYWVDFSSLEVAKGSVDRLLKKGYRPVAPANGHAVNGSRAPSAGNGAVANGHAAAAMDGTGKGEGVYMDMIARDAREGLRKVHRSFLDPLGELESCLTETTATRYHQVAAARELEEMRRELGRLRRQRADLKADVWRLGEECAQLTAERNGLQSAVDRLKAFMQGARA